MNEKKYLKLLCKQTNEEQKKILLDIDEKQENQETLKDEFQKILINWFDIYGENNKMTFQQFFYFWIRNTDKQASREPENISKNFFTRHIQDESSSWNLNSFLSYFKEKSSQRPNLVLRMLLCHDYDINLKKLVGTASLLNTYGSIKIYEEKDIIMLNRRVDCNKITFISKIEDSSRYITFLSNIQSLSYLYEGYYGVFVMYEYLKLLKYHLEFIQRIDIKPLNVTSFIRVKYEEINELSLLLVGNRNIKIYELILSISFEKQRSQMNTQQWEIYQQCAQKSIFNLHNILKILLLYNLNIIHFKYRLKISDEVFSKDEMKQLVNEMQKIPIKVKMLFFFKSQQKCQTQYRKEIIWDCFNIVFGIGNLNLASNQK